MNREADILNAAAAVAACKTALRGKKILIGFDGFVDEIIHAVATRKNNQEFERIQTIAEFAERIASAAGKSANIELVTQLEKLGGNGPIMSLAACGMGCKVTSIGLMGHPELEPVFQPLRKVCEQVISIGKPGHTDALEFQDGKLMLGKLTTIKDMCWARLLETLGEKGLCDLLFGSDMVACTNWTMLTEMGEILDHVISLVPAKCGTKFFFDLADPEKRSSRDLEKVLQQIQSLNRKTECVLGLNLREAEQVSQVLGIAGDCHETLEDVEAASSRIRARLELAGVVVHAVKFAGASRGGESAAVKGPYCPKPKLSTGAGDHFNAGFCGGLLAELSLKNALYLGVGTSGWYVRNGASPALEDVVEFLRDWGEKGEA